MAEPMQAFSSCWFHFTQTQKILFFGVRGSFEFYIKEICNHVVNSDIQLAKGSKNIISYSVLQQTFPLQKL